MAMPTLVFSGLSLELFGRADAAIAHIPPAFPLSATVAVNPFLGQSQEPCAVTAARLGRVAGLRMFRDRTDLIAMWDEGRLTEADLEVAAATEPGLSGDALRRALSAPTPQPKALPDMSELAEAATGVEWSEFVTERIGAWAAAHFDQGQAFWPAPDKGLYASWRAFASRDLTPGIAGLSGFASDVAALPDDPRAGFAAACGELNLTGEAAEFYFHRLLMSMGGWAQYARHMGWIAERDGGRNEATFELLTIRLIWDLLLHRRYEDEIGAKWAETCEAFAAPLEPSHEDRLDAALQEAADRAAERALAERFEDGQVEVEVKADTPAIQAAFCIDVRSEILRRALENADQGVETIGFAGFFGLAVEHMAEASDMVEARAPILLNPGVSTRVHSAANADFARRVERRAHRAWGRFKMAAVSAFAFVEAAAPLYVGKLIRDAMPSLREEKAEPAPRLDLPLEDKIGAANTILRAMSLTDNFAGLVLIAGHGSTVANAPHASALQCGACGGHAGDVNARLLTGLLNDTEVRIGLRDHGIDIPDATHFIAGLHDTVSDEVRLYDDQPDASHDQVIARLKTALSKAATAARMERAMVLPRAETPEDMPLRGVDWSELRPEWGLAGCAAFIAAPRSRSAGQDLGGRAFLHDYDWQADEGFGVLELILTAPVVVASWISLQYKGSALAPEAFGAGNKLLHNVTGGIGVVEGNGGLLRAGLPWQSVHDGDTLRHEPLRLSVVVEAPAEAISTILETHPQVRALFDNGWLALFTMDGEGRISSRYESGSWRPLGGKAELRKLNAA
ncbi:YbcC family protein [Roseovarius sp. 2305UL8-3]|uniref:YbcC family protein n=1 Tax=Roseovarius conchicola TaxID=3121636 RepID=UPI003527BF26